MADKYVSKKELWMFSLGGLGQGMIYAMMSSYISDYYMSVLHLAPVFVLLLIIAAVILLLRFGSQQGII